MTIVPKTLQKSLPQSLSSVFLRKKLNSFELCVLLTSFLLSVAIIGLNWQIKKNPVQVSYFSWNNRKIGVDDRFFSLTFNRPVNGAEIEKNLSINPPLPGKISWNHNTLFYTLTDLPVYGANYQVKLPYLATATDNALPSQPFNSVISTRDRAFVYIGVQEEERGLDGQNKEPERGRLVLTNITDLNKPKKTILTPRDLIVTDFDIYPYGDRILFLAYEPNPRNPELNRQQLYTVTTGLPSPDHPNPERAGKLEKVLDAHEYQNISFDLSENGQTILVLRQNLQNLAELGLWMIAEGAPPHPLGIPASEFVISPEGDAVSISQKSGVGIIPLKRNAEQPQFFAEYEKSLGFTPQDHQELFVRFNRDYTRSLILLNEQNQPIPIYRTPHPILDCQFDPRQENYLYCLKIDSIPQETGQISKETFLSVTNLKTGQDFPLLALPNYPEVQLSLSPDGLALLFDQVITQPPRSANDLLTDSQQAIVDGQVWFLPLPNLTDKKGNDPILVAPKAIEFGHKPRWMP